VLDFSVFVGEGEETMFGGSGRLAAACVVAGFGLAACGSDSGSGGQADAGAGGNCYQLDDGQCVEETFRNPPVLQPDGDGVYQLELKPTEFTVEGKRHCGRGYNGLYPAPTIDVPAASDGTPRQVRVNLRNLFTKSDFRSLSGEACECADEATGVSCEPSNHEHGHGDTCQCTTADGVECHLFDFNVTNLHAHGSHVRPDYATGGGCVEHDGLRCRSCSGDRDASPRECYFADDVISRVGPGEGVQHRWDFDEDGPHHEGLDWYHPHIHGSTAIQVASGATGALIIRGPVDELPGIKNARERIFLMMTPPVDYAPLADGQACDEDHITFNEFSILGDTSKKQTTLINGIRRPRLIMAPGQIERWRFLHGSFLDEEYIGIAHGKDANCEHLDTDKPLVPLTQIARDGITMPRPPGDEGWPFAPPYIFLSPGYRIEAMLDGSQFHDGETLCLMSARFLAADENDVTNEAVGITTPPTADDILRKLTNGDLIGIVNVTSSAGQPTETHMPDLGAVAQHAPSLMLQDGQVDALARCQEVSAIRDPAQIDQAAVLWAIFYNMDKYDACGCHDHNINCRNFEETDRSRYPYDRVLVKGAVDHWRLVSGFDGHPFHIHINPFLVCPLPSDPHDPSYKGRLFEPPFAHWRDTYLVDLDRKVDVLTEYRKFTGDYVFHCHKLNHEDHGMMELVHVCDPATEDCDTLCDGHPCGWRDCSDGDTACQRQLALTDCILNPETCPDALLRCKTCDDDHTCPPDAYCSPEADHDGKNRCVPGCQSDDDCGPTETCGADGACAAAAPCAPPCGPGTMCLHGSCQ
jgi:FtsP/CotA-like multicopper oxidase with cupredoxin domain